MSPSAFLRSPPFWQPPLGFSPFSATWTQMGSWEVVYLPPMKSWGIGCSLQYSSLPLIIPLHFHSHVACPLLLFSHLFPNASLVTRRKQKQRRWFIQAKPGFELPSVLHLFWNRAGETASPKQSLFSQCIPSLPPQHYLHSFRSKEIHC